MTIASIPFIAVTQPVGTFYVTMIKAGVLLDIVDVLPRSFTPEGRQRVQREYSKERGREIAEYACRDDATFPTSVIVAAYDDHVRIDPKANVLLLGRPILDENPDGQDADPNWDPLSEENPFKIGEVIDGQHRLLGIRDAINELDQKSLRDFELPVVFMLDLKPGDKAYIFSTINSKQRVVSSSLIADLFGLREGRSPRKICHEIAEGFYQWEKGPFYHGLKMLGKKTADGEMLSQGSFAKYVLRLISRKPDEDEMDLRNGAALKDDPKCPLREYFITRRDPVIARILHEYFSAIQETFPKEWSQEPEKYLLRKTVGFAALTRAFMQVWDKSKVKDPATAREFFQSCAKNFKTNLGGKQLTSEVFGSSEKGAREMANAFLGKASNGGLPVGAQSAQEVQ